MFLTAPPLQHLAVTPFGCSRPSDPEFVKDHDLQSNAAARGRQMNEMLAGACDTTDWVGELRGKGLMQAIECVQPGSVEPNVTAATQLIEVAKTKACWSAWRFYGNVIRLTPMLNVSEEEMSEGCEIIISALNSVTG